MVILIKGKSMKGVLLLIGAIVLIAGCGSSEEKEMSSSVKKTDIEGIGIRRGD